MSGRGVAQQAGAAQRGVQEAPVRSGAARGRRVDSSPNRTPDPTLQAQARALGDPTRFEIFRYLAEARHQVGVQELADHFGFNPNAIRQHVTKLLDAGMIVEEMSAPHGRGRPARVYRQSPTAQARWGAISPYEQLSLLMSEMLRTGEAAIEVGRRAGRRHRLGSRSADALESLVEGMAKLGFEPRVEPGGAVTDVVLDACPFSAAALVDPDNVCQLHLGMAEGMTEGSAPEFEVEELRTEDPRRGGCILRLRRRSPNGLSATDGGAG